MTKMLRSVAPLLLSGLVWTSCRTQAPLPTQEVVLRDLSPASPDEVGLSSARLERLDAFMQRVVDEGKVAGAVTLLARHGKLVHLETFGYRDLEAQAPMPEDAIFRIYSMTKPVTGVALMILYEEGKFRLSDPVEKYIPELRGLKVAASDGPEPPALEEAAHPMTIRELMSHSAGLTYGLFSRSSVDAMYQEKRVLDSSSTLAEMVEKLAAIPLLYQPGTRWHYSVAVDVQGYLVEVLSGMPFDRFLEERLFVPLGMKDTGFYVPADKAERLAQVYSYGDDGGLLAGEGFDGHSYLEPVKLLSGGAGLVSTARDYLRFCQMLLNGGELDGVRILAPLTVALMHKDQLPQGVEVSPGRGFGLDFAVVNDPVRADGISKGEYYWLGIAGTWFWIDPVEDLAFVGMIQQFGDVAAIHARSRSLVYQAVMEAHGTRSTH